METNMRNGEALPRWSVMTFNANGLRSAAQKGFWDWWATRNVDCLALQETKAQEADLQLPHFHPEGYYRYLFSAQKKGYSGVGLYTRHMPQHIQRGLGWEPCDGEGRYIHAEFSTCIVASVYLPSGTAGPHRQAEKIRFMDRFFDFLREMQSHHKPFICCGDWNIAHQPIDLKNWKANQKNSGFLPEERAWLTRIIEELGYRDLYRDLYPDTPGYTWWSHRGQARARNVGWRIDYQLASPALPPEALCSAEVNPHPFFSDHAPLECHYRGIIPGPGSPGLPIR